MDLSFLGGLPAHSVVFWSGAGISHDPPTNGLLGADLTKRVLESYFESGVYNDLQDRYLRLEIADSQARPRLETVLDTAAATYGLALLADALSDLAEARPNPQHAFFAKHLLAGGSHITANFDTCIERSLPDFPAAASARLLHFHGALGAGASQVELEALGGRLGVIENGLPVTVQSAIEAILADDRVQALVFVGYSGSDFFDAGPYLLQRGLRHLSSKLVAWLNWAPKAAPNRTGAEATAGYLSPASAIGASVVELVGPLDELTDQLGRAWLLPPDQQPHQETPAQWQPELDATPDQRARATAALYARMGFRQRTVEVLAAKDRLTVDEHELLADALWGVGRYRLAGQHWQQARFGDLPEARARRAERVIAVHWIRGQLLRAERAGWSAIESFVSPDSGVSTAVQLELLETYARVLTHLERLPDVRHRVNRQRKEHTAALLASLGSTVRGHEGLQLRARTETAAANLEPAGTPMEHSTAFAESEALHGWLNYTQGELRHRAEAATGHGQPYVVPVPEYLLLRRRFIELGAWGDVPRVGLLPGAEQAITPVGLWRDLRQVDLTDWHRFRLLGGFLLRWLRSARRCWKSAAC